MANEDKEIRESQANTETEAEMSTKSTHEVNSFKPISYDELESAFGELYKEFRAFCKKYSSLKKELKIVKSGKETCMCDNSEAELNNLKEKEMHAQNLYAETSKKLDLAVSQADSLKKELETTFDVNLVLLQENEELQKRVDGLTKDLEKLTKGK